jgi:hypothetical protein
MRNLAVAALLFLTVACSSKEKDAPTTTGGSATPTDKTTPPPAGSGSAAGSGGAMTGSGGGSGGGSSAMAGSGAGSAAGSGAGSGSAAFDFDKLTHEEKIDFMKKQVVPTMKPLFQDFDKKKYANFGCKTCHGKDPQKAKYKMPNPELPKLDFAALKAGKQAPKVAKFMGDVVKPQMAKILQQSEYSESNPTGFGCLECHQAKK